MNPNKDIAFSPIIIGTMRLGEWGSKMSTDDLEYFIDACIDLGLKDFDHADIYGNYTEESKFGDVIKRRPDLKSRIQITTKCGIKIVSPNRPAHKVKCYDSSKEHILWSADNSLKELGVDQLDVLLIHRPDYLMNPSEIAEAFTQLKFAGKVKFFGVSNFNTTQFELLHSLTPLVTNQMEISPLHRAAFVDGTLDQCIKHKITPQAWSPMGGGKLFTKTGTPKFKNLKEVLIQVAEKYEVEIDSILLAWLRKHPAGIVPVIGTSKIERIKKVMDAGAIKLDHQDWYKIWEAALGREVA